MAEKKKTKKKRKIKPVMKDGMPVIDKPKRKRRIVRV